MNEPLIPTEELISVGELAAELRITKETVRDWISKGTAPKHFRFGPRVTRFRREDVVEWLQEKYQK